MSETYEDVPGALLRTSPRVSRAGRIAIAITALLAALFTGDMATAPRAEAAYPTCNTWVISGLYVGQGIWVEVPAAGNPGTGTASCVMSTSTPPDGSTDDSQHVVLMQEALAVCYNQNIVLDGHFGPATRQALKIVQSAIGVTVDGIYGPRTHDAMLWPVTNGYNYTRPCYRVG